MDNEKAIKILENYHNGYFGYKIEEVHQAHKLAIKALEAQRWIPVTERLPESTDDVLVFDGCDMFVAWNSGAWNRWHSSDDKIDENTPIIAWMPLPKPYTKEEQS